jgi:hypothetical protein
MMARGVAADARPEETATAVLVIAVGNIMELEERVVALEKHAGIPPKKTRPVDL